MKNHFYIVTALMLLNTSMVYSQNSWFVDNVNGSDVYDGSTELTAFKTVEHAVDNSLLAGDTLFIIGNYYNSSYDANYSFIAENDAYLWHAENTISINNLHGTSSSYITIKAYTGDDSNPTVIRGDGANIFRVRNSSYIRIEGLEIEGEVDRIPMTTAAALQFVYIDADNLTGSETAPALTDIVFRDEEGSMPGVVDENEVYPDISNLNVKRPSYIDTRGMYLSTDVHHIEIVNNTIHHTPGNGLRVSDGKYITISGNDVHNCSRRSYSGTHGFVVTKTEPTDNIGDTAVYIYKNRVHHNYNEQFSWSPGKTIITPIIDEGKGISLQRNNTTDWVNGNGRILVENNLCYWNGFSGVHSNDGFRIDFVNNTSFMNSYTNTVTYANDSQQGNNIGVSAQGGDDVKMINNISIIDDTWGGYALSSGGTSNLVVINNLIYGINGGISQDNDITSIEVNTTVSDPLFADAPIVWQDVDYNFDFHLLENSDAINSADELYAPLTDFYGNIRDANPDIGAVEYFLTSSIIDNEESAFKLYPNPTNGQLNIDNLSGNTKSIVLVDLQGREVKTFTGNTSVLDVSNVKNGVYFLKIETKTSIETIRILKK